MQTIHGTVIKGDGYGKKLGFPTVNLSTPEDNPTGLQEGIYCGVAILEGKRYPAGLVIGPNSKIEAHMIGYEGNAYGKEVRLEVGKFLRRYMKFETEEELIDQIKKDISLC